MAKGIKQQICGAEINFVRFGFIIVSRVITVNLVMTTEPEGISRISAGSFIRVEYLPGSGSNSRPERGREREREREREKGEVERELSV